MEHLDTRSVTDALRVLSKSLCGSGEEPLSSERWKSLTREDAVALANRASLRFDSKVQPATAGVLLVELFVRAGMLEHAVSLLSQVGMEPGSIPEEGIWGLPLFNVGWALHKAGSKVDGRQMLAAAALTDAGLGLLALRLLDGADREALSSVMSRCEGSPAYGKNSAAAAAAFLSPLSSQSLEVLLHGKSRDHNDTRLAAALHVIRIVETEQAKTRSGKPVDVESLRLAARAATLLPPARWVRRLPYRAFVLCAIADLLPTHREGTNASALARKLLAEWPLRGALTVETLSAQMAAGASLLDLYVRLVLAPELGIVDWLEDRTWKRPLLVALGALQLLASVPALADGMPGYPPGTAADKYGDPANIWWGGPPPQAEDKAVPRVFSVDPMVKPAGDRQWVDLKLVDRPDIERIVTALTVLRAKEAAITCGDNPALKEACSATAEALAEEAGQILRETTWALDPFQRGLLRLAVPAHVTGSGKELASLVDVLPKLAAAPRRSQEDLERSLALAEELHRRFKQGDTAFESWRGVYGDLEPLFLFIEAELKFGLGDVPVARELFVAAATRISIAQKAGNGSATPDSSALWDRIVVAHSAAWGTSMDTVPCSGEAGFLVAVISVVGRSPGLFPARSPDEVVGAIDEALRYAPTVDAP